jgi:hypothetical protein
MTKNIDDFFRYETYNVAMAEPFNLCVCLPRFTGGQEVAGSSPVAPIDLARSSTLLDTAE